MPRHPAEKRGIQTELKTIDVSSTGPYDFIRIATNGVLAYPSLWIDFNISVVNIEWKNEVQAMTDSIITLSVPNQKK